MKAEACFLMVSLILPCRVTYAAPPYPPHGLGRSSPTSVARGLPPPYELPLHQMTGPVGKALLFLPLVPARSLGSRGPVLQPSASPERAPGRWRRPQACIPRDISRPIPPSGRRPGDLLDNTSNLSWRTAIPTANTGRIRTQHMPHSNRNTQVLPGPEGLLRGRGGSEMNIEEEKPRAFTPHWEEMDGPESGVLRSNPIWALSCSRFKARW